MTDMFFRRKRTQRNKQVTINPQFTSSRKPNVMSTTSDISASDLVQVSFEGDAALLTFTYSDSETVFPWGTRVSEHRINPLFVEAVNDALDLVTLELHDVQYLVVTGQGRFFSNGMDLQWIHHNQDKANELQKQAELLMARILTFQIPTVAAINGHFCAAGGMLGMCFDYRVMVARRAVFFVPAVELGLVYSTGMIALLKAKIPKVLHRDVILLSERFHGPDLLKHGMVDKLVGNRATIVQEAMAFASERFATKSRSDSVSSALHTTKVKLYQDAYDKLSSDTIDSMGFDKGKWTATGRVDTSDHRSSL